MNKLQQAAAQALEAIEQGESFDYLDRVIAPALRDALKEQARPINFGRVRTITADGRCLGWDGNEINTAA
jgi:hypothetical protein